MSGCKLCENQCGVSRAHEEKGACNAPGHIRIASESIHLGEESFLVPSHTIFFMGCNMACNFCQNYRISNWFTEGERLSPLILAKRVQKRHEEGAKNVNFVGGEPTPYTPHILKTLDLLKGLNVETPVVWNSNFYMSEKTMDLLNGVVDLWLPDFKYGNSDCAKELANCPDYWEKITRNLKDAEGSICIRHLVLPGHEECCTKPILDWIAKEIPEARVNVMGQYMPRWKANQHEGLNEILSVRDYKEALRYAKGLGIHTVD